MAKNKNREAVKAGMLYTAANFLCQGIGIITTPIFTRILSKEEFGEYSAFASILSILTIVITLNLEASLSGARVDYKERLHQYILSVLTLSSVSVGGWLIFFIFNQGRICAKLGMNSTYLKIMLVYLFFLPAINLFQTMKRFLFEYKTIVLLSVSMSLGTALLSVLLAMSMEDAVKGRIIGTILPAVLIGMFLYGYYIKKGKKVDFGCWSYALKFCLPYVPHLLSLTILASMDRIMIKRMCGAADTALYSLAYNCGALVTILMTSVNNAYSPWLYGRLDRDDVTSVRKFTPVYILSFSGLALGIMLIAPELLKILGGGAYLSAVYVMPPVAMGCLCQFFYTMFVNVEQWKKSTTQMAFASASAAVVNYELNSLFIPRYGYIAAAYTTLASYAWLFFVHMFIVYRMGMKKVYDYRLFFVVLLAMILCMMIVLVLYSQMFLRWGCILLYAIMLLFFLMKKWEYVKRFFEKEKN